MRKLLATLAVAAALGALGATMAFAGTKRVSVGDNFYSTSAVTIHEGSTVKWVWRSDVNHKHNVTAYRGAHFHSRTKSSGSFSHTFKSKGTFSFECTQHPSEMKMKVKVL